MTAKEMKTARPLKIFSSYYKPHWPLFALDMLFATGI